MRPVVFALLLLCSTAVHIKADETERVPSLDSLRAGMLPERDEGHDSYFQKLFRASSPPAKSEQLIPHQEAAKLKKPQQTEGQTTPKAASGVVAAPVRQQTAPNPSRPKQQQSATRPAAGSNSALPTDMSLNDNYESSDLPEITPVQTTSFVEAVAEKRRRRKSKWVSCANQCGGEHAVIKALKSGRQTPTCCVDLLYETTMYVHRLLSRNRILYWAMKGTLLGVVREKGIIPHDYDIDIGMLHRDLNKVASLRRQIEKDGYVLLRAPWTGYNNMNFVILKKTRAVRDYFRRNPVSRGERPLFTKELRKISIAAELMVFKKMRGQLVQVLCTQPHPRNPDLYLGAINPAAYDEYLEDKHDYNIRKNQEKDGWLKYANQKDKPWVNFFKKFKNGMSPFCEHTAPASFRYDVPVKWVLPPRRMQYYSKKIYVPRHPFKFAAHYFGPDFMTPKRRYDN